MDPRFAAADAAFKANRVDEGVGLLVAALSEGPGPAAAYRILGNRLFAARRYAEVEHWARAGLERAPKEGDLWNLLGVALRRQQRYDEALVALEKAHKLAPKLPMALINKANVLNDMGKGAAALEVGQKLVRMAPGVAEHHRIVAVAYRHMGQLDNAAARFDTVLRLQPSLADAWIDRAGIASLMQKHDEAADTLIRGLTALPGDARLLENRAILLRRAGRYREAEAELKTLLAQGRNEAWVHFQLGRTLGDFDRPQANLHYTRAAELAPDNQKYRLTLAESLDRSRYGDEGANIQQAYEALVTARQMGPVPLNDIHIARQLAVRVGDYPLLDALGDFAEVGRYWARSGVHGPFLGHLGRVQTPQDRFELLDQHREWGRTVSAQAARAPLARPAPRPRGDKIRLGFMSSDLRNHPVGYFALPLFQYLDRERFEVFCYSFYTGEADATQKYISQQVSGFRWVKTISDRGAAQLAADDQLDMLIELGGSTHMNRLDAMAYRPAPLQASWLGYPHSAGLEAIDYLVVDPYMTPQDPALILEKPMTMPHTWLCLGSAQFRDGQEINPVTPQERNGFVTFGTANNPHKYGPAMLRTWARVVASVPGSQFLWVRPEGGTRAFRENMLALFAQEGVGPDRVRFQAVRGAHLPFYNEIDIALDTFPLTGGTTTCETLWMGVPVVSLIGEALFERLSYSILTNAGLGDLASRTVDDYVATALSLAADPARRMVLRATLRDQIKASPLYQHKAFAQDFYDMVAQTVHAAR